MKVLDEDIYRRRQYDEKADFYVNKYRYEKSKDFDLFCSEKELDKCFGSSFTNHEKGSQTEYCFLKVIGVSYFEDSNSEDKDYSYELLKMAFASQIPLSIYYFFDGSELSLYIGTENKYVYLLKHLLMTEYPDIDFIMGEDGKTPSIFEEREIFDKHKWTLSGALRGIVKSENNGCIIDKLVQGSQGIPFMVKINAVIKDAFFVKKEKNEAGKRCNECYFLGHEQFSYSESQDKSYSLSKDYYEVLGYGKSQEEYENRLSEGIGEGMWETSVVLGLSAYDQKGLAYFLIPGIMCSELYTKTELEPIHFLEVAEKKSEEDEIVDDRINSLLTSKEAGSYFRLPRKDVFGFQVRRLAEFDEERNESGEINIGKIVSCSVVSNKSYAIKAKELTRHCLVVGLTGSGKTNTTMNLALEIKNYKIPIMVIEPAKSDYWKLYRYGFRNLHIFGTERGKGTLLRINPFECREGISVQSHIDAVFSAFKASFSLYPPMPYVLENAIVSIYEDRGWNIAENTCIRNGERRFPTIENLYDKIPVIIKQMGYAGEQERNIMGALHARINSLRIGSKGNILNVSHSTSDKDLFETDAVVELEDIGDDDAKAFIMSLILIRLSELRRSSEDSDNLIHTLFIEEAHRLLKNVQSAGGMDGDPRANAVEYFCNLLAEMRSKGQGFVIVDQLPAKLAVDLIENTNLKIVHRSVAERERTLMGGAMNMTDSQQQYLSCLKQGVAAVYSEGDIRPKLVKPANIENYIDPDLKYFSFQDVCKAVNRGMNVGMELINQKDVPTICSLCPKEYACNQSCYVDSSGKMSLKTQKLGKELVVYVKKHLNGMGNNKGFIDFTPLFEHICYDLCREGIEAAFCFVKKLCDIFGNGNDEQSQIIANQFILFLKKYGR